MISIGSTQIDAWIVAFIFPLSRILGFIATAPLWSSNGVPRRTRLILGLAIAVALTPSLPIMPAVQPASLSGLWIMGAANADRHWHGLRSKNCIYCL